MSGPQKGEAGRGACKPKRRRCSPLSLAWEASDQRWSTGTPLLSEWRFLRLLRDCGPGVRQTRPVHHWHNSATFAHLPALELRCSIKGAYQAADAGHPGWGRASSPQSKQISPGSFVQKPGCTRRRLIEEGHHQRKSRGRAWLFRAKNAVDSGLPGKDRQLHFPFGSKGGDRERLRWSGRFHLGHSCGVAPREWRRRHSP